jgi:hypothetical protein
MPTMTMTDNPDLWRPEHLVGYFHNQFTEKTFRNWRSAGVGPPFVRIGGRIFYRPDAVREWAKQQENASSRRAQ